MFEKLQGLTRVLVIPAIVLYFCGYLCITGYFTRFGFITFDIFNARFLIAGLNVLVPLALCLWFAWIIFLRIHEYDLVRLMRFPQRYWTYLELLIFPAFAAQGMHIVYGVASFSKMSDPASVKFGPILGKFDIPGRALFEMGLPNHSSIGFIFGVALYIAFYALVIIAPMTALVSFFLRRRRRRAANKSITNVPPPPTDDIGLDLKKSSGPQEITSAIDHLLAHYIGDSVPARVCIVAVDLIFLSVLLAVAVFTFWELRAELFDSTALSSSSLDYSILYSWFFTTTLSLLLFSTMPWSKLLLKPKQFQQELDPYAISQILQMFAAPILTSVFLFGATIFPRIPFAIGGGEPREVSITFKENRHEIPNLQTYLIGESAQYLFAIQTHGAQAIAIQINKDATQSIQTWHVGPTDPDGPVPKPKVNAQSSRSKVEQ